MPSSAATTELCTLSLPRRSSDLYREHSPSVSLGEHSNVIGQDARSLRAGRPLSLQIRLRQRLSRQHLRSVGCLPHEGGHHDRCLQDRKSTRLNSSHTVISYAVFCRHHRALHSFPTTTLFRSLPRTLAERLARRAFERDRARCPITAGGTPALPPDPPSTAAFSAASPVGWLPPTRRWPSRPLPARSEEHTSELQSHSDLVCRLLPPPPSSALFPYHDALPISTANTRRASRSASIRT